MYLKIKPVSKFPKFFRIEMQRQLTVKEEICVQQQVSSKYVEPDETKNWPKPGRWTKHMKQQCKELLATPAQVHSNILFVRASLFCVS